LVSLGVTPRGTHIIASRALMEADLRVVVGNIEPHHFAGFSGGYKTAAIGLAGRQTITENHAMLIEPGSGIAVFDGNPLRQDIEEIGQAMGIHVALNAVLNGEKKIVQAVCGSPRAVMQAGISISQAVCQVQMHQPGKDPIEKYDLVIASAGGAPKDINFYQAQKALTHATLFVRRGGVIILAAACEEGVGSRGYVEFMRGVRSNAQVFELFRELGFRVGPHKAFQVARISDHAKIPPAEVENLLMTPAPQLDDALRLAIQDLSDGASRPVRAAILPRATNTIPYF
jgi:nickel-dependent lactate racemase